VARTRGAEEVAARRRTVAQSLARTRGAEEVAARKRAVAQSLARTRAVEAAGRTRAVEEPVTPSRT
jgi:hypothetical protein